MRITESQLRRIIREEVRRAVLNEAAYTALPRDQAIRMSVNMVNKAEKDNETEREKTLEKLGEFLSSNNLLADNEEQKNKIIQLVKDKKFEDAIKKIENS